MNNKNKEERQQDQDHQQSETEPAPPQYTQEAGYQQLLPRELVTQSYQPYHDADIPPQYLERQEQVQDQLRVPWAGQQQSTTALPKRVQDCLAQFSKKQQQRSAWEQKQREAAIKMEQQRQEYFERQQQQRAVWAEQQRELAAKIGRERLAYVVKQQEQRAAWAEKQNEYAVRMDQQRQVYFENQQEQRAAWAEQQLQAAEACPLNPPNPPSNFNTQKKQNTLEVRTTPTTHLTRNPFQQLNNLLNLKTTHNLRTGEDSKRPTGPKLLLGHSKA
ncbi:MAG: hypothetical protein JOS17DRAFT_776779 [Linnemannia elongata]|nr:MAG: hypothetical protein JOS17DRAFT_776779 [Linnemannia elongata]